MKKREITPGCKFGMRYLQPPHRNATDGQKALKREEEVAKAG